MEEGVFHQVEEVYHQGEGAYHQEEGAYHQEEVANHQEGVGHFLEEGVSSLLVGEVSCLEVDLLLEEVEYYFP